MKFLALLLAFFISLLLSILIFVLSLFFAAAPSSDHLFLPNATYITFDKGHLPLPNTTNTTSDKGEEVSSALPHGQNATKKARLPTLRTRLGNKEELHHWGNTTSIPSSPSLPVPPLKSRGEKHGGHNVTPTSSNSSVPIFPVKGRAVEHHGQYNITLPPRSLRAVERHGEYSSTIPSIIARNETREPSRLS